MAKEELKIQGLPAAAVMELLIKDACEKGASDIHIDPLDEKICVKFRIDGILQKNCELPKHLHGDIIGRIKILSSLRTDEHSMPQDGRFRTEIGDKKPVDVRVSVVPTYFGECAVLRLLRDITDAPTLSELGMCESDQKKVLRVLNRSSGMILVTGPTGSGKTTTLYTILKMLNDGMRSIVTIEDPIEYALPGIRQIQTSAQKKLTFASGLRAVLRQDPDIIMVGEIRDTETAYTAIHTALTGHLLLSTLHTNDAATAIPRLIDMGIEPYLIASTIGVIIGQRLVRKSCKNCLSGCDVCNDSGYKGRTGIYEVMASGAEIQDAIMRKSPAQVLSAIATKSGMRTMENDGLEKVESGVTKIEEILAAIIE